tara:strand:- start:85 stop:408 length:324 start_codon:yes stop_codon:yes gene_type:complete
MIPEINIDQLKEKLDNQEEIILIDVRFEQELQYGKIKYSIMIPLPELPDKLNLIEEYKNKEIIVYCRSGGRSAKATEYLIKSGFKDVKNLVGGILAWKKYDTSIKEY